MGLITPCLRRRFANVAAGSLALLAAICLPPVPVVAQQAGPSATFTDGTKPVLVVSIGSVNKLTRDINYVTGVVGQPQFGGMFSMMAGVYAQGMDMDRPLGLLVPMVNGTPEPIVVVPTSDVKPILKRLEAQTGPIDELEDGTLVLTIGPNTAYVEQNKNYAVAARNKDALKLVPDELSGLFEGMGNEYDVAMRLNVQQIPLEVRNVLVDQLRRGFESAMQNQQPDADSARQVAEQSIEQLEQLIQQADQLMFGLNIDQSVQNIGLDFAFTAVSGSELAAVYGGQQSIPSRFASVIRDDAAAYFHSATSVSAEAAEQASASLDNSFQTLATALSQEGNLSEDQIDEIESYTDRLKQLIVNSLKEGKADLGGVVLAGPSTFQVALGTFVADGGEVAALAQDLAKKVPDSPDAPKFQFNTGTFNGVTMHLIEADVPATEEEARSLFGETIQIHIGTAPKAIYLALGQGSEALMKELITAGGNDTESDRPLAQIDFKLLPFMQLAQSVEQNDAVAAIINALSGSQDKGQIRLISESIPNGSSVEVTFGEGLLRAIGAGVVAGQRAALPAQ